jgi:hypothetical protein
MDTRDEKETEEYPQVREESVPCSKGCGFYGTKRTNFMCSSCFKKHSNEVKAPEPTITKPSSPKVASIPSPVGTTVAAVPPPTLPAPSSSSTTPEVVAVEGGGDDKKEVDGREVQKNRSRCFKCKKKIGFTGCECRCGYVFCGDHRYADVHACDFDYRAMNKKTLTESNPVIAFAKVEKL